MHTNSKLLFEKYAIDYFKEDSSVLEIGPDKIPSTYKKMVFRTKSWDTLDIYSRDGLTYLEKDNYNFEIQDNQYDIVLSGQVIEHVPYVWYWVKELARITNNLLIIIGPISWKYHKAPVDCWRIYPDGMIALYDYAGVNVITSKWESLDRKQSDVITIGRKR